MLIVNTHAVYVYEANSSSVSTSRIYRVNFLVCAMRS